jgi:alginate O-acetyltransferase complex protein AlgI
MGIVADEVFALNFHEIGSYTAWIGILAYTFQIYFDFSGYSDMAIGLGRMLGFKFPENFDNPYISQSITEFWRRWHISLGNWMRNYLYIPLGGNRVKWKPQLYFNLWLVFLASGLWHGASWSFVLWGAYHGLFLVIERSFLLKTYKYIGKFPSTLLTFLFVMIGWVFFRIEQISDAFLYISRMFSFKMSGNDITFNSRLFIFLSNEFYTFLFIAALFAFFTYFKTGRKIQDAIYIHSYTNIRHMQFFFISVILLILSVSSITSFGFNPFIYFRF